MKVGRCGNFGGCTKADGKELIPIMGPDTTCPECHLPLTVKEKNQFSKKWLWGLVPLALAMLTWVIFLPSQKCEYGQNSDGSCKPRPVGFQIGECKFGNKPNGDCESPPAPPCPNGKNAKGECNNKPLEVKCTINPADKPTKADVYSVIEIGSEGIKPIAVEFLPDNGRYIPFTYDGRQTENVSPRDPANVPYVVDALCKIINSLHADYGDIPLFLVGSSSMVKTQHYKQLDKAIAQYFKTQPPFSLKPPMRGDAVDYLSVEREAEYLSKGIWIAPLPTTRHCQSLLVDVGSGNIKGGYIERCNPNKASSAEEVFTTFEIPDFGTTAFTHRAHDKDAATTRIELAQKMDEQKQRHPHLLTGKTRIYVVGGAAWALNTLLCLDCPQYRERSITDDINEYTVIKPSDIEEFYRFVTNHRDEVCQAEQNPYTRRDLDGGSKIYPRNKEDIDKHNHEIVDVCNVFKPNDLVSAAEIMRTLAGKLGVSEKRPLFLMQNNLYTWSRQYLIQKLSNPQ